MGQARKADEQAVSQQQQQSTRRSETAKVDDNDAVRFALDRAKLAPAPDHSSNLSGGIGPGRLRVQYMARLMVSGERILQLHIQSVRRELSRQAKDASNF